jgi:large subunit ribosomal protein L15e
MSLTTYLRNAWKKPDVKTLRERMIAWRKSNAIVKVEKPLRLDRARSLGYKAKQGIIVTRVRIQRGGHKRKRPNKARRTKRLHIRKNLRMNYKEIAEQRVGKKYSNMEVINSYQIGKDGKHYFYEVILADRNSNSTKRDKQIGPLIKAPKKRAQRALTSTARKARGLRNSPVKAPKVRPSLRANRRRGN